MSKILNQDVKVTRVVDATAAGTTDINGTGVDMQAGGGYDGVMFIALFGVLTATQVTKLKAQVSSDDGSADAYADLADSLTAAMADTDDDKMVILDVIDPPERYVRPVVDRGTANAVIDGVIAIQYRGKKRPSVHDATVAISKTVIQKAEGTA